jgi:integrase/recombinase XerD
MREDLAIDIHSYSKRLRGTLRQLDREDISQHNRKLIRDFVVMGGSAFTPSRNCKVLTMLMRIAKLMPKDFDKATRKDIERLVLDIDNLKVSGNTKYSLKQTLKTFYRWLHGGEDMPRIVSWIRMRAPRPKHYMKKDLLSHEDVKKMIGVADHPMKKAFIATLFNSGARIGEIGNLKIKDVEFDSYGCKISLEGKTRHIGNTRNRFTRLVFAAPYLAQWLDTHPQRDNPDAPLWVGIYSGNKNRPLKYISFLFMVKKLAQKAGIEGKKCNPQHFRKSWASYASAFLTPAQMSEQYGWVQGSRVLQTYIFPDGDLIDEKSVEFQGGSVKVKKPSPAKALQPRSCPRCKDVNPATNTWCGKCGSPLDEGTALQADHDLKDLLDWYKKIKHG